MTFEQRKQERQALVQHLMAQDWNVFGTLKFVNGRTIGRETSANKLLAQLLEQDRPRDVLAKPLSVRTCACHAGALHTKAQTARTSTFTS